MSASLPRVRVAGTGLLLEAHDGEDLLELLQRSGCPVTTACGGIASCGLCRIQVLSGAEALSARRPHEAPHVPRAGDRLACQARIRPVSGTHEIVVRVLEPPDPDGLD